MKLSKPQVMEIKKQVPEDISNWTLEQVQEALDKLQAKAAQKDREASLRQTVDSLAQDEWEDVERQIVPEFSKALHKEREMFRLMVSLDVLLGKHIGPQNKQKFFEVLSHCNKQKSFLSVQRFYQNVPQKEVKAVGKIAFAAYRLNARSLEKEKYLGEPSDLRGSIREGFESLSTLANHKEDTQSINLDVDQFAKDIVKCGLVEASKTHLPS